MGSRGQEGVLRGGAAAWGAGAHRPTVIPVPKPSLLQAGGMSSSGTFWVLRDAWGPGPGGAGVGADTTSAGGPRWRGAIRPAGHLCPARWEPGSLPRLPDSTHPGPGVAPPHDPSRHPAWWGQGDSSCPQPQSTPTRAGMTRSGARLPLPGGLVTVEAIRFNGTVSGRPASLRRQLGCAGGGRWGTRGGPDVSSAYKRPPGRGLRIEPRARTSPASCPLLAPPRPRPRASAGPSRSWTPSRPRPSW